LQNTIDKFYIALHDPQTSAAKQFFRRFWFNFNWPKF